MSHIRTFIIAFITLFGTLPGGGLFAQNAWETLPVFHGGRVMPLNTFAQQVVREVCGTTRPFIVWDDAVMTDFNRVIVAMQEQARPEQGGTGVQYPFMSPVPDFIDGGFDREWSPFGLAGESSLIKTELPIQGFDRYYVREFDSSIRKLVPMEGRYFAAGEIFFSWICEPEVWRYIPIFPVPESDYLSEIFNLSFSGGVRTSQSRVSLYQLENSPQYKKRLAEILRRRELGQATKDSQYDRITERLESQAQLFRELTFHPQRCRPTRMLSLLYQAAGLADEQSSYTHAFDAWGYLLTQGDVPGRQSTERLLGSSGLTVLHPTTQRWHTILDQLHLLLRIYDQTDSSGNPVFPNALAVELQYEALIDLIDTNLAEAAALMETVYPGVFYRSAKDDRTIDIERLLPMLGSPKNQQNQSDIRQFIVRYHYAVKKLRNEVEAAYLALYDNGRSLRFLPLRSSLALELGSSQNNFGVQPWASAQMILGSGEPFVRRFFDPQVETSRFRQPATPTNEDTALDEVDGSDSDALLGLETSEPMEDEATVSEETVPGPSTVLDGQSPMDRLFLPPTTRNWLLQARLDERSVIGNVRVSFRIMLDSYSAPGSGYGNTDFAIVRAGQFQDAVRPAAVRIETHRALLVDNNNPRMVEQFEKTAYPHSGPGVSKLRSEYNYSRLDPFYWMWIFALLAIFFNGGAYIVSVVRRKQGSSVAKTIAIHSTTQGRQDGETELKDYTNTLEEWLFIGSVVMLTLSMFIAFTGAAMRTSITGWAPVTNMYEIIVMMALAAAMIGTWYTLYPLVHPALELAWVFSKFPRMGGLLELYAAIKARRAATRSETSGESAIREAAEDFGVTGSAVLGDHPAFRQNQSPEKFEAQQRVNVAQRKIVWQCLLAVPRLILTFVLFYAVILLANEGRSIADQNFWMTVIEVFKTSDTVDFLAVVVSVVLFVWLVPHLLLMLLLTPVLLLCPAWIAAEQGIRSFESKIVVEQAPQKAMAPLRSEMGKVFQGEMRSHLTHDAGGAAWLKQARNAVLDRKLFIAITAVVVFVAGLSASLNRVEFNPDFRPIPAVLRSNYWLTVHVSAFFFGYASMAIAWGMAVVSLGFAIFGRYQRIESSPEGQKTRILLPDACQLFTPVIERLIRISLLLLIVGTVLGGRWADYSWGRFWSWDPKEVWALITIVLCVIIFHGKIARYYGAIGVTVGALLAMIAVVITAYGVNFVFKSGLHAYGGGTESIATSILIVFIATNLLWGALALLRYCAEVYGNESEERFAGSL